MTKLSYSNLNLNLNKSCNTCSHSNVCKYENEYLKIYNSLQEKTKEIRFNIKIECRDYKYEEPSDKYKMNNIAYSYNNF